MTSTASDEVSELVVGVSVRATIAAAPEQLWPWISDPTRHPQLAGSGEPRSIRVVTPEPHGVGMRFEADQAIMGVIRYVSHSDVLAYAPNRRFYFRVEDHADWDFILEPVEGGTLVTHRHRFQMPTGGWRGFTTPLIRLRTRQNAESMVRTLQNLARLVGAPPPTRLQVSYRPPTMT